MRAFALLLALALALVVVVCAWRVTVTLRDRGHRRRRERAVWKPRHSSADGHTVVEVALTTATGEVLQRHTVAELTDGDPRWQERFIAARQEAEERAYHLNS